MRRASARSVGGEGGEPERAGGAKGGAVVHADGARQAVPGEDPAELVTGALHGRFGEKRNMQDGAAVQVTHCEWIDPATLAGAEVALEVGGPHVVAVAGLAQRRSRAGRPPTAAALRVGARRQAPGTQPATERGYRGQSPGAMAAAQERVQLTRAPSRPAAAQAAQPCQPDLRGPIMHAAGAPRAVNQAAHTARMKTRQPLVGGFSADGGLPA